MKWLAATLLFVLLNGCKKEPEVVYDFSIQTITDSVCNTITQDLTDWTYDQYWTRTDSLFVLFNDNLPLSDTTTGWVRVEPLCPNPGSKSFTLKIHSTKPAKARFAIVNTDLEMVYYASGIVHGDTVIQKFDLNGYSSILPQQNYRLYYAFFNSKNQMYYKGHGDFRVE